MAPGDLGRVIGGRAAPRGDAHAGERDRGARRRQGDARVPRCTKPAARASPLEHEGRSAAGRPDRPRARQPRAGDRQPRRPIFPRSDSSRAGELLVGPAATAAAADRACGSIRAGRSSLRRRRDDERRRGAGGRGAEGSAATLDAPLPAGRSTATTWSGARSRRRTGGRRPRRPRRRTRWSAAVLVVDGRAGEVMLIPLVDEICIERRSAAADRRRSAGGVLELNDANERTDGSVDRRRRERRCEKSTSSRSFPAMVQAPLRRGSSAAPSDAGCSTCACTTCATSRPIGTASWTTCRSAAGRGW